MAPWLIVIALAGLVVGSHFVPTPEEVQASFKQGQKFYAAEDYEQAIETYERINRIESPLLYTAEITAEVGEIAAPVKEIALYQTGNSYLKRAEEARNGARRARDPEDKSQQEEQAAADFERAATYFQRTEAEATSPQLKDLARNRLITVLYESGAYDRTVEEGHVFIDKYPDSNFLVNVLYNVGWAHFETGHYEESIAAFEDLVRRFPKGYRAERSLFQIGEAHYQRQLYGDAVLWYQQVVERQNIDNMKERDLLKMRREKIAGLVDETALELAAKAQIKIGDCHAAAGDVASALAAYNKVITAFSQEQRLVSEAYIRLADMYTRNGDQEGAVRTYREAIDGSQNRIFQAGMQSLLADYYYERGDYGQAIFEYQLYLDAYGDVAAAAGLAAPWASYKIGRAHYEVGQQRRGAGDGEGARTAYQKAIAVYRAIERDHPASELTTGATQFNVALSYQMMGDEQSVERAVEIYGAIVDADLARDYVRSALFQIARIHFQRAEYQPAIVAYERILQQYPQDPQRHAARFELALCYRDLDRPADAVAAFEQIDSADDLYPKAMLEAGNLLAAQGARREALQTLDRGLKAAADDATRARFFYMKGRTLIDMDEYEKAVEDLSHAVELTSDAAVAQGARYGRGVSLLKLQRFAAAVADLKELLVSDNPELAASARRMIGLAHLEMGREREAIDDYVALVAAAANAAERAEHMLVLAELHYGLRDFDQVEVVCLDILALDMAEARGDEPYFPKEKAYFLLGDVYSQRQELYALISTYREALSNYPASHYSNDMRFALGQALFDQEDLEGADRVLSEYLQRAPEHANRPYGLYYLGYARFNLTRFEGAAQVFETLAAEYAGGELAPDALFRAAEARYNLDLFEEAQAAYQRLLERYPQADLADDALYNQAWSLLNLKREVEAIEAFKRMAADYPNSPLAANAQFTVGDFYYNGEQYGEALTAYKEVLQRFPDSEVARKVPALLGDLREAVAYQQYAEVEKVFARALEEQEAEQFRRAIEGFERIARDFKGTESEIGALSNMGVCYESLGEWKKAVATYEEVMSRFSGDEAERDEAYRFARMHKEWIESSRL